MNKIYAAILGLAIGLLAELAFAAPATVNSVTGNVQAIPGAGTPRILRQGDDVNQAETIVTGPNSSVVLVFEDNQIVALPANSRMTVSTYVYNRQDPAKSNVLLSLVEGGMRAVTGLIGRQRPSQVAYRAGNATIGIRGTDVTVGTVGGNLAISVTEGGISFTFQGKTTTVNAGEGVDARTDGSLRKAALAEFIASLSPEMKAIFSDADKIILNRIIQQAGQQDLRENPPSPLGTLNPTSSSSGTGGGGASTR
jgi:hypothetical protein